MTTSSMNSTGKGSGRSASINLERMISFGSVGPVKLMRHVCYAMTASRTPLMKDMKSISIIHKLEGVVIAVTVEHGNLKGFVPSMGMQSRIPSLELLQKFSKLLNCCSVRFQIIFFVIANSLCRLTISRHPPALHMNFTLFDFTMTMFTLSLRSSRHLERYSFYPNCSLISSFCHRLASLKLLLT